MAEYRFGFDWEPAQWYCEVCRLPLQTHWRGRECISKQEALNKADDSNGLEASITN